MAGGDGQGIAPASQDASSPLWNWSGMFRQGQPEASPEVEVQDAWDAMMQRAPERMMADPAYRGTWLNPQWVAQQYSAGLRREVPWSAWNWTLPGGLSFNDALNVFDQIARGQYRPAGPSRADAP
jgi:hypothetical protein